MSLISPKCQRFGCKLLHSPTVLGPRCTGPTVNGRCNSGLAALRLMQSAAVFVVLCPILQVTLSVVITISLSRSETSSSTSGDGRCDQSDLQKR